MDSLLVQMKTSIIHKTLYEEIFLASTVLNSDNKIVFRIRMKNKKMK